MIRNAVLWAVILAALAGLFYAAAMGYLVHQPTPEEIAHDVVARINAEREAQGLQPLIVNEHLTLIAQWRSEDMVAGDYYSHHPPDGHPTLADFCARLGYDSLYKPVENILFMHLVFGQRLDEVAERTVDGWQSSPGHWGWAVSPYQEMTGVGVAVGDGYVIVTQLFWSGGPFTPASARQHNRGTP